MNVDGVGVSRHPAKYVFFFVDLLRLSDPKSNPAYNTPYNIFAEIITHARNNSSPIAIVNMY
jgi:hypothetical protein